jgi:hypothetical protein
MSEKLLRSTEPRIAGCIMELNLLVGPKRGIGS